MKTGGPFSALALALGLLALAWGGAARAQGPEQEPASPVEGAPTAEDDALGPTFWDDWTILPLAFYRPETSVGLGLAVIHTFPIEGREPRRKRPTDIVDLDPPRESSIGGGVIFTFNEQYLLTLRPEIYPNDRLAFVGELEFQRYPIDYFPPGAGADTPGEPYDEFAFTARVDSFYRVRGRFYLGLTYRLRVNDVTSVVDGGLLDSGAVLGRDAYVASGIGPVLILDSRNRVRAPTHGFYGRLYLTAYTGALGSEHDAVQLEIDARVYQELWKGHVLALRGYFAATAGSLPFQLQPRLGGADTLRGWLDGQLRDDHAVSLQLEYRFPFLWRFGLVAFASAGQAVGSLDALSPGDFEVAGGAGLRFLLNEAQHVHVRVDVAYGSGLRLYIDVLEAF